MATLAAVAGVLLSVVLYFNTLTSQIDTLSDHVDTLGREGSERFLQVERSFEELEDGQQAIFSAIATSQDDINFRIGSLSGRLLERDK